MPRSAPLRLLFPANPLRWEKGEFKAPLGGMAFGKDLRLTPWSFRCRFPPDPLLRETGVPSFGLAVAAGAVPS